MAQKPEPDQRLERRSPRQARAQHKVALMFEAAIALLEQGDVDALTTNAVAARAGVSIGTLYQYFQDKEALLDALAERELAALSQQVLQALQEPPKFPGDRIRRVMQAVLGSCNGSRKAHRHLLQRALTQPTSGQLSPLYAHLQTAFASDGVPSFGEAPLKLSPAQAFVLTHALAGVLRTLAASTEPPPLQEVEDALVLLAMGFLGATRRAAQAGGG